MTTSQALQPLHVAPGPAHDNEMMAGPNEQWSHSKRMSWGFWKVLRMLFPIANCRKLHLLAIFSKLRGTLRVLVEPRYTKEIISYV